MSFSWLDGLDLVWATTLVSLLYLLLLIWCVTRPARLIFAGAPDRARWRDLRIWVTPLIIIQLALHWLLR